MEHSSVQWIQIPAKKINRAVSFYKNVFDSAFFFEELNGIPHAVFRANEEGKKIIHGAIIEVEDKGAMGNGPVLFFDATGNFETFLALIKEFGGTIVHSKTLIKAKENGDSYAIPNTYVDNKPGYYAHFLDSEGNKMGLYGTN